MLFNKSCFAADLSKYDVIILDPPFEMWGEVADKILKKTTPSQTVVCVSNFQNMFAIYETLGKPRVEIIWTFPNGKWVSHSMPQLAHENVWIYGRTNESYLGMQNSNKSTVKTSSIGRWGDGTKVSTKPRVRKQINTHIHAPRVSDKHLGRWVKPPLLARTLIEYTCVDECQVLDAFAGVGGFSCILDEYLVSFDAYETNEETYTSLTHRLSTPHMFKKRIVASDIKDDSILDMFNCNQTAEPGG